MRHGNHFEMTLHRRSAGGCTHHFRHLGVDLVDRDADAHHVLHDEHRRLFLVNVPNRGSDHEHRDVDSEEV